VKIPVIASGRVATLGDIRRLKELENDGVEGVIVGRALYTGAFTLRDALKLEEAQPSKLT
jgi:phosphoribosylformimino-5-aminoimidazole carboxamide ribonucleotide (ProFAR) isomerase